MRTCLTETEQYGGPRGPFLYGLTTTKHFITKIEKLWTTEKGQLVQIIVAYQQH